MLEINMLEILTFIVRKGPYVSSLIEFKLHVVLQLKTSKKYLNITQKSFKSLFLKAYPLTDRDKFVFRIELYSFTQLIGNNT